MKISPELLATINKKIITLIRRDIDMLEAIQITIDECLLEDLTEEEKQYLVEVREKIPGMVAQYYDSTLQNFPGGIIPKTR